MTSSQLVQAGVLGLEVSQEDGGREGRPRDCSHEVVPARVQGAPLVDVLVQPLLMVVVVCVVVVCVVGARWCVCRCVHIRTQEKGVKRRLEQGGEKKEGGEG
jgi:hypothetical protein